MFVTYFGKNRGSRNIMIAWQPTHYIMWNYMSQIKLHTKKYIYSGAVGHDEFLGYGRSISSRRTAQRIHVNLVSELFVYKKNILQYCGKIARILLRNMCCMKIRIRSCEITGVKLNTKKVIFLSGMTWGGFVASPVCLLCFRTFLAGLAEHNKGWRGLTAGWRAGESHAWRVKAWQSSVNRTVTLEFTRKNCCEYEAKTIQRKIRISQGTKTERSKWNETN